jgi:hypothetical protein
LVQTRNVTLGVDRVAVDVIRNPARVKPTQMQVLPAEKIGTSEPGVPDPLAKVNVPRT